MASPFIDIEASLAFESERLKTFFEPREDGVCGTVNLWSSPADITPMELAKDGFYFLKKDDHCACIFCHGSVFAWEEGDTVRGEHKKHFPYCPFIRGNPVGNIPMSLCEHLEPLWRETVIKRLKDRNKSPSGAMYADFSLPGNREASFTSSLWSMDTKKKLSNAGFYSVNYSDHVRCFRCGLGLRGWSDSMNPLEMHAKYSPNCMVVVLIFDQLTDKTHHDINKRVDDTLVDRVIEQGDIERYVATLGFPFDAVKAAVKKRLLSQGTTFHRVRECLDVVLDEMKEKMRVETAVAQTLAAYAMSYEDTWMDMVVLRIEIPPEPTGYEDSWMDMVVLPHQQQQEQQQEPTGDEPSHESTAANSTRAMDLHYASILEGTDFDMGAGEVSDEVADETTTELSEEEEGSPTNLDTEVTIANVEEAEEEEDEKPSVKNHSKLDEIIYELACKVCFCEEAVVVLFPCKHLCMCPGCALSVGDCPICRTNIVKALKITRC